MHGACNPTLHVQGLRAGAWFASMYRTRYQIRSMVMKCNQCSASFEAHHRRSDARPVRGDGRVPKVRKREWQPHSVEAQLLDAPDDGAEVLGHAVGAESQVAREGELRVEAKPGAGCRALVTPSAAMPCAERFPYLLHRLICQADSAPAYAPEHDVVAFATGNASGMDGEALAGSARHQHSCRTQVQSFSGNGHVCAVK